MKNHINDIEPQVKEAFAAALYTLKQLVNEPSYEIARDRTIAALTDYKAAAYMDGYYNALGDAFQTYCKVFYTAATCMVHFKYYHWNEKEN